MFVGEIGIPRREFLYDICFWEARRIIRGYRKRGRLEQQLLRLSAYMSCFAFRENKKKESPSEWLPFEWENEDDGSAELPMSEDEINEMKDFLSEVNGQSDQ